jgi:hypothetical protein
MLFLASLLRMESVLAPRVAKLYADLVVPSMRRVLATMVSEMWTEIRAARSIDDPKVVAEVQHEFGRFRVVLILTALSVGLMYVTVFGWLTWRSALAAGWSPGDAFLLVNIPEDLREELQRYVFPRLAGAAGLTVASAVGACVGALLIGGAFVAAADAIRISVGGKGLLLAIVGTSWFGYATGTLPFDSVTLRLVLFKVAYLLRLFSVFSSLPDILGRTGVRRAKYERFFNGLYALAAGWLLARGFGPGAELFTGVVFVAVWFVATILTEATVFRDPRFLGVGYYKPMTVGDISKRLRGDGKKILALATVFIGVTIVFHAAVVYLYVKFIGGRV